MKRITRNTVDEYLSLRRVLIISLTITLAYYILYTLSHYYGRPSFGNSDNTEEVMRPGGEMQRPEGQMRKLVRSPSRSLSRTRFLERK